MDIQSRFPDDCRENEFIMDGPAGGLQARLACPRQARQPKMAALLCHPHPLYGGNLDNKVVYMLASTLARLGIVVLRFNFRGVGKSEGQYAEGEGETRDAEAAAQWLRATQAPGRLWLAGFSFGAYVALRAAKTIQADRLTLVAPPVQRFSFQQTPGNIPCQVIQGEADEVVDPQAVHAWVENLNPRPDYYRLPEATHFFHGRLTELRDKIMEWDARQTRGSDGE